MLLRSRTPALAPAKCLAAALIVGGLLIAHSPMVYAQTDDAKPLDGQVDQLRTKPAGSGITDQQKLQTMSDPAVVDRLITELKDTDPDVRTQAASRLGEIGAHAIRPLTEALNNPDAKIRAGAITSLTYIAGQSGSDRQDIIRALVGALKRDATAEVRSEAAAALGSLRVRDALDALIDALKDPDPSVRATAAQALADIDDERALGPLRAVAEESARNAVATIEKDHNPSLPAALVSGKHVLWNIDLSREFTARPKWRLVVTEAPEICATSHDALCFMTPSSICFLHDNKSNCEGDTDFVVERAAVVRPNKAPRRPLLVLEYHPDVPTSGGSVVTTTVRAYRPDLDAFTIVFSGKSSHNNSEETRLVIDGPLAGDIIVSHQPLRPPWRYGITVYRPSASGKYVRLLDFLSRDGGGSPLAVIDEDMPEILQRLHLWKPGDAPPIPPKMPARCSKIVMQENGVESCS
jgi:hypothetical protein